MRVEVVRCPAPGQCDSAVVELPAGATVADALASAGLEAPDGASLGIWGRRCEPSAALRDRDRVEIYRALTVDPMQARRLRQRRQTLSGSRPR